ncbi:helix-turn-helix domain-containing protein [Kocuria arenosa]
MLQRRHLLSLHEKGKHTQAKLAEVFGVARSTVYRTTQRELAKRTR